jgi:hypothetical protein
VLTLTPSFSQALSNELPWAMRVQIAWVVLRLSAVGRPRGSLGSYELRGSRLGFELCGCGRRFTLGWHGVVILRFGAAQQQR